ncbi:hypothetical protein [Psychrobacillus sp.]|uniref:hypothetical protein n=1 Tax=Psychrobacillus sp. TaxID=1871623 RepID=UPI0028BDD304|nr:hypothetical protein [Psychrobacillus sp.]
MFIESEWVKTDNGKVGYVIRKEEFKSLVNFPKIKRMESVMNYKLTRYEETIWESNEDLVNITLDTWDKEWFMEVTR